MPHPLPRGSLLCCLPPLTPLQAPIPLSLLREYIAFARATCHPELSPEAAQALATAYADMRSQGMSRKVGAGG